MPSPRVRRRVRIGTGAAVALVLTAIMVWTWQERTEKRVQVVVPGKIVRGAWQRPIPMERLIRREGIKTLVTLTAINRDDPKYVEQAEVVSRTGVDWVIVPMRGSTATLEQLAEAADLLASPDRQPVFFHCVGGHHRSNLVQAAFRIRHQGWTSEQAWDEVRGLPWTRPDAEADRRDRALIERFALQNRNLSFRTGVADDGTMTVVASRPDEKTQQ